mmetsp:Transcript_13453/g.22929  ORF Transcript_13453/g.22929 Transcript_13453/m.22929 type:complete len:292 (+) Transcript_13453:176-1051(+)
MVHSSLMFHSFILSQKSLLHATALTRKRLLTFLLPRLRLHQFLRYLLGIGKPRLFLIHLLFNFIVTRLIGRLFVLLRLFLFGNGFLLRRLLGFGLLLFLFEHVVVLHGLSPDDLAPTRFNFISLGPNFLHLSADHCLRSLIALPLLHTAHTLRIQLVHPGALPLYVGHDGNIGNATFHKRLGKHTMMCAGLSALHGLTRFPSISLAFALHLVIFVHGRGKLEVEFVTIEIREEVVHFGILPFFAHLEEDEDYNETDDGEREVEGGVCALDDFLGGVGVHFGHFLAASSGSC